MTASSQSISRTGRLVLANRLRQWLKDYIGMGCRRQLPGRLAKKRRYCEDTRGGHPPLRPLNPLQPALNRELGQAQFAGTPPTDLSSPVPLVIGLGVAMNPAALAESVPAYLRLVQGLGTLLEELEMAGNALIDAELAIHPDTQAATIRRLAAMRQLTIDMASPADWLGLIGELHRLKPLLEKTWELVAAQEG